MKYNEAGEIVVTLTKSIKDTKGREVNELAFTDPTSGDLEDISLLLNKVKKERGSLSEYSPLLAAIATMSNPRISYGEARKLDLADLIEVGNVLDSFPGFKAVSAKASKV